MKSEIQIQVLIKHIFKKGKTMSHFFEKNQPETTRKVNFSEDVMCACTGQKCEGTCSEEHLRNNRTGTCISAFNLPKSRDRKIQTQNDEPDEYRGVFGEY